MSAIVAAQWTAVATVVLAVFAVVTAVFAFLAFKAQGEQVSALKDQVKAQQQLNEKQTPVLELQAKELQESIDDRKREAEAREREAAERRRAQARRVFLGVKPFGLHMPTGITAMVQNSSNEPIFDAQFRWYKGVAPDGTSEVEPMTLLPGEEAQETHEFPPETVMDHAGAVLIFRDAAGVQWRRRLDGTLTDLDE
jgi:hypothetical protein